MLSLRHKTLRHQETRLQTKFATTHTHLENPKEQTVTYTSITFIYDIKHHAKP